MKTIVIIGNNLQTLIKADSILSGNDNVNVVILSNGDFCKIESTKDILKYQRIQPLLLRKNGCIIPLIFSQGFLSEEKICNDWKLYPIYNRYPLPFLKEIENFFSATKVHEISASLRNKKIVAQLATTMNIDYVNSIKTDSLNCLNPNKYKVKILDNKGDLPYYNEIKQKWNGRLTIRPMIRIINIDDEKNIILYDQRNKVKTLNYYSIEIYTNKLVSSYLSKKILSRKNTELKVNSPWEYKTTIILPNVYEGLSITGLLYNYNNPDIDDSNHRYSISVENIGEKYEFTLAPDGYKIFLVSVIDYDSKTEISIYPEYRAYLVSSNNDTEYHKVTNFINFFVKNLITIIINDLIDNSENLLEVDNIKHLLFKQDPIIIGKPLTSSLFNNIPIDDTYESFWRNLII